MTIGKEDCDKFGVPNTARTDFVQNKTLLSFSVPYNSASGPIESSGSIALNGGS
jgi:hypothetical protein